MTEKAGYAYAELREMIESGDIDALNNAGLIDEDAAMVLEEFRRGYQPSGPELPHFASNTKEWENMLRQQLNTNIRKLVRNGKFQEANFATGITTQTASLGELETQEKLRNWLSAPARTAIFSGDTGSGKTSTALKFAHLYHMITNDKVATNIKSAAEENDFIDYVFTSQGLREWSKEKGNGMMVADEWSSVATGYAKDAQDVEQEMSELVRKLRKDPYNLSLLIIGHRKKDIHPTLANSELADFVHKQDKQTATIYDAINRNAEEFESEKIKLSGLSDTDLAFDTNEDAIWQWTDDADYEVEDVEDPDSKGDNHKGSDRKSGNQTAVNCDESDEGSEEGKTLDNCPVYSLSGNRCHRETIESSHFCSEHIDLDDDELRRKLPERQAEEILS